MRWIDYKNAYDMVPHSWMIQAMKMVRIADNIVNLKKTKRNGEQT